jgi:dienelactone hydrolase
VTRNFSPWASWMLQLAESVPADPLPDADHLVAEFDAWRDRAAERLSAWTDPRPRAVPLQLETTGSVVVADGGYTRHRVVFDAEATMSVPAYLLVPDDRAEPGSAVLAIHGHGTGKDEVCGLVDDDPDEPRDPHNPAPPNGDYAHQLAAAGHVVLAPDLRCFGERADWNPPDHYGCDVNLVHGVMAGRWPLAANLWDLARALDVLEQHPLVDPDRLGVAGLSYGGTCSLFLAALDHRVAAVVVSGYLSSLAASHRVPWNMCGSQVLPGMIGQLDHVDLGALVAPRPLLVESGADDPLFPQAAARQTVEQLRALYRHLGAPEDALIHDVFPAGHQWHGSEALPFLDRQLA